MVQSYYINYNYATILFKKSVIEAKKENNKKYRLFYRGQLIRYTLLVARVMAV